MQAVGQGRVGRQGLAQMTLARPFVVFLEPVPELAGQSSQGKPVEQIFYLRVMFDELFGHLQVFARRLVFLFFDGDTGHGLLVGDEA